MLGKLFSTIFLSAAGLMASAGQLGCAQCRIPAIDQTGQHIFAGTTTLANHNLLNGGLFHHRQQPAAVAPIAVVDPLVKPPCQPPVEAVPVVPVVPLATAPVVAVPQNPLPVMPVACAPQVALPGRPQPGGPICETQVAYRGPELTITPARIVAPINSEVVMAAGICSPNGYYVMRQPLEWMLAQDGVGQIVAVGHESPHNASLVLRSSPQKLATNYARAHTSTISQVLDRGTPTPADDVYLQKGQSWISITSPTEGQTSVVVWTPKEQNWDRRKATATIYWVDAAWRLPQSTTARAGQPQPLLTALTRASGEPIPGWIVRYEVIDGPPASFGRAAPYVEVRTDVRGVAVADLVPASLEPGITTVRVQIIRPGIRPGDAQMIVGQGTVGVQWTTPGLSVRALGSSDALADGTIGYRVEVTNNGDLMTHNVALSFTPPTGITVLNSTPIYQTFGQRLEWRIGDLPPGTTSTVEVNCRAAVAGSVRSTFLATSAEVPRTEHVAQTEIRANALVVKMVGPEAAEVGREARFLIDVTNNGPTALTNVTATDTFEPGLSHTGGERSPLVRPIPIIQPGQTERFAISFVVAEPGRHCHRLDVTADGGHTAGARACVTGTAAVVTPPQISVRVSGPPASRAGEVAPYSVEIKNGGSAPATNVVLTINWGTNLQLTEATSGHEDNISQLTTRWKIAQLVAGETQTRRLNFVCRTPDPQGAIVRATVASDQTTAVMNQAATMISTTGAGPSPPQAATPLQSDPVRSPAGSGTGNLRLSASVTANPISSSGVTTLVIGITNERDVPDRDVSLSVQSLDDGITLRVSGTSSTPVATASATAIDFAPIREMRPGEQLVTPFRLDVRGMKPGTHKLRISATSALSSTAASTDVDVVVNP
jgi:uncharacterized repeat protein (TIGR01451 family)